MEWLWIPITIAAAFFQNLRTVLQKHLKGRLSTNGSNFTRYVYGFPLAILYLLGLHYVVGYAWPDVHLRFAGWLMVGALAQIFATSLLIHVFSFRNFSVGVAYSKTEAVQTAIFGLIFLGEAVSAWGAAAIAFGTAGVMVMSLGAGERPLRAFLTGWTERSALIGILSGACFGISAVGFRGASLSLEHESFLMAAGFTLACGSVVQSLAMGGYLAWREPGELGRVWQHRKVAVLVGITGIIGSACWFTAMTIQVVAYVRTLGMIELVFTFIAAHFFFRERTTPTELAGIALLVVGIIMVLNLR